MEEELTGTISGVFSEETTTDRSSSYYTFSGMVGGDSDDESDAEGGGTTVASSSCDNDVDDNEVEMALQILAQMELQETKRRDRTETDDMDVDGGGADRQQHAVGQYSQGGISAADPISLVITSIEKAATEARRIEKEVAGEAYDREEDDESDKSDESSEYEEEDDDVGDLESECSEAQEGEECDEVEEDDEESDVEAVNASGSDVSEESEESEAIHASGSDVSEESEESEAINASGSDVSEESEESETGNTTYNEAEEEEEEEEKVGETSSGEMEFHEVERAVSEESEDSNTGNTTSSEEEEQDYSNSSDERQKHEIEEDEEWKECSETPPESIEDPAPDAETESAEEGDAEDDCVSDSFDVRAARRQNSLIDVIVGHSSSPSKDNVVKLEKDGMIQSNSSEVTERTSNMEPTKTEFQKDPIDETEEELEGGDNEDSAVTASTIQDTPGWNASICSPREDKEQSRQHVEAREDESTTSLARRNDGTSSQSPWCTDNVGEDSLLEDETKDDTKHGTRENNNEQSPRDEEVVSREEPKHFSKEEESPLREVSMNSHKARLAQALSEGPGHTVVPSKTSFKKQVQFRDPFVKPSNKAPVRLAEEVMKTHSRPPVDVEVKWKRPSSQLEGLINAARGNSLSRRSNACGTMKVLATNTKNKYILPRTTGFLAALSYVCKQDVDDDCQVGTEARIRAVTTIVNLSIPKDSRSLLVQHGEILEGLIAVIENDKAEARALACVALTYLSKTRDNKLRMAESTDLLHTLAMIIGPVDPTTDDGSVSTYQSYDSQDSESHLMKRRREQRHRLDNEHVKTSRANACAVLMHLTKDCASVVAMCRHEVLLTTLADVSTDFDSPIHTRCIEVLCHFTRFPANNRYLASQQHLVDSLMRCTRSEEKDDRVWSCRALQNMSADEKSKVTLATNPLLTAISFSALSEDRDEQMAALGALLNLSGDAGTITAMTNTKNVVSTLINLAHFHNSSTEVRLMACDCLAAIGLWLQTLAASSPMPEAMDEVLPTHAAHGWQRWDS